MSYAKAEVIYGVPITEAVLEKILKNVTVEQLPTKFLTELLGEEDLEGITIGHVVDALGEDEDLFEGRYSGSADETPRFLGVSLCGFNEGAHVKLKDLQTSPTADQYMEATMKRKKLPKVILEHIDPFDIYIFWSTS